MVIVSLDSPSCEVTLFDPVYRWFIGTLPDRPRDFTVWSTLEPSGVDSRTWAGIIQVGSATAITTNHHGDYSFGHLPPTTIPWRASLSSTEPRHRRTLPITDPVCHGSSLSICSPLQARLPQGLPWFTNAGNPIAEISSLSSYSLFSLTKNLIALI
jgi:hypothetical protein